MKECLKYIIFLFLLITVNVYSQSDDEYERFIKSEDFQDLEAEFKSHFSSSDYLAWINMSIKFTEMLNGVPYDPDLKFSDFITKNLGKVHFKSTEEAIQFKKELDHKREIIEPIQKKYLFTIVELKKKYGNEIIEKAVREKIYK
ncbi:hypothetical protein SAMN02927937_00665 [Paenimyroides aquimaris]|uniref:Uncharacterized protein n=1 Tax=Paenimyroides marinum TaxID=1159016 RepID=A0A1H6JPL8_9FLAO|nr:hypothetical protein [Paenimyroides aquimaris]SEH64387.1 hypothetical protein SAMN02927937_00665 [Paenimyroides aquimaris]